MSELTLIGVSGATMVLLQLAAMYLPSFNTWFQALPSQTKQLITLAANLVVAGIWAGFLALKCLNIPGLACPTFAAEQVAPVFIALGGLFLTNVGIQQGLFSLLPAPKAVVEAKAARDGAAPVG